MLVVVVYDIETKDTHGKTRLRKIAKLCKDWGMPVQNSVYECEINPEEYQMLKNKLQKMMLPEKDSVRFYLLGSRYQSRMECLGYQRKNWCWGNFLL